MPEQLFLKCPNPDCGHVFKTERELVDTYNAWMTQLTEELIAKRWYPPDFVPVDDADQIWLCPFCQESWE